MRTQYEQGEILALHAGMWEDHGLVGLVRVLQPLDLADQASRYQWAVSERDANAPVRVNGLSLRALMSFDAKGFAAFLVAEGRVERVQYSYVHLGDADGNPFDIASAA